MRRCNVEKLEKSHHEADDGECLHHQELERVIFEPGDFFPNFDTHIIIFFCKAPFTACISFPRLCKNIVLNHGHQSWIRMTPFLVHHKKTGRAPNYALQEKWQIPYGDVYPKT